MRNYDEGMLEMMNILSYSRSSRGGEPGYEAIIAITCLTVRRIVIIDGTVLWFVHAHIIFLTLKFHVINKSAIT